MFSRNRTVFISHSAKNAEIVDQLSGLLQKIGIPPGNVFCSSILGQGVNNGEKLNEKIHVTIKNSDIIIYLLSDAFINSSYCMEELGIGWFLAFLKKKTCYYLRVPDIEMDELSGFVNSRIDMFSLVNSRDHITLFVENISDKLKLFPQKNSVISNCIDTFVSAINNYCLRDIDNKTRIKEIQIDRENEIERLSLVIGEQRNQIESYKRALELKDSKDRITELEIELRTIENMFFILGLGETVEKGFILEYKQFFFNMINRYEELQTILKHEPVDGNMEKLLSQAYLSCEDYEKAYRHFRNAIMLAEYITESSSKFFVNSYPYTLKEIIEIYEEKLKSKKEGLEKDFIRDSLKYFKLKEAEKNKPTKS